MERRRRGPLREGIEVRAYPTVSVPEYPSPEEFWEEHLKLFKQAQQRGELPSQQLPSKLLDPHDCHLEPSCIKMLDDPAALSDRSRWPDHLCYDSFLLESTERWTRKLPMYMGEDNVVRSTPARRRWDTTWPLPIGKKSVIRDKPYLAGRPGEPGDIKNLIEVLNLVPFDGYESALWALRIERNDSTLDLFGLCDSLTDLKDEEIREGYIVCEHESEPFGSRVLEVEEKKDGARIVVVSTVDDVIQRIPADRLKLHHSYAPTGNGKLAFSLKGQDTSLLDLVHAAKRWWSAFEGTPIGGRPTNSGTWRSADEFKEALSKAISTLHARGRKLTQESVSSFFSEDPGLPNCTDRQLRRWLAEHCLTWPEVKKL